MNQSLVTWLILIRKEIDTYGYRDSVSDRESQIQMIADEIRTGNVKPLSIFLQASIDEGIDEDSDMEDIAGQVLEKLEGMNDKKFAELVLEAAE